MDRNKGGGYLLSHCDLTEERRLGGRDGANEERKVGALTTDPLVMAVLT